MTLASDVLWLVLISGMALGVGLSWLAPLFWRWCGDNLFKPRFLRRISLSEPSLRQPIAGKNKDV